MNVLILCTWGTWFGNGTSTGDCEQGSPDEHNISRPGSTAANCQQLHNEQACNKPSDHAAVSEQMLVQM